MSVQVETARSVRVAGLDRLRGLAVVLMVLDHVLLIVVGGGLALVLRLSVTRLSLPLFCVVAGALVVDRPRWRRLGAVVLAGYVAMVIGYPLGIGQPDVLVVLAVALAVAPLVVRVGWALPGLCWCLLQATTWPFPWRGYQPGVVLGLVLVGHLAGRERLGRIGDRLPEVFERVGRRPLAWYLGHLLVLGLAVAL